MPPQKARRLYTEVSYEKDCYIMFGKESAGIPEEILVRHPDSCIRIPMLEETRSLNLSNSVAIILYEALRQHGFENLEKRRTAPPSAVELNPIRLSGGGLRRFCPVQRKKRILCRFPRC